MTPQPGALVHLATPRFVLRSMAREDVTDGFIAWLADPEVMLGLNLPRRRLSRPQAVRFVLAHDNVTKFCLGIFDKANSRQIGFFTVNVDPRNRTGETSVVIGERVYWGKDVVREARSALLDFMFDTLDVHKVIGRPHARNFASIYNYQALGFRCEAVLREQLLSVDRSTRIDQMMFGILRSEWHAKRPAEAARLAS